MIRLDTPTRVGYDGVMEQHAFTDLPPSQQGPHYTFGGKIVKKTLLDDLIWELERECKRLEYTLSPTDCGYDLHAPEPEVFIDEVADRYKLEVGYCSNHYINIYGESDNGNYSPPRLTANIRKVLKALRSGEQLTTPCTESDCDQCESAQEQKEIQQ